MKNLKLRHFIPIFGVDSMDQLNKGEEFLLMVYNLIVLTLIGMAISVLTFKYIL